jgi:hypothetical protein
LLYNNFGTFSQDYLNILFNSTVNFEFKFDQFTFSQAKVDLIQQEIFTEFLCYVQYLNDIFEIWSTAVPIGLKEISLWQDKPYKSDFDINVFKEVAGLSLNQDISKEILDESIK